MAAEIPYDLLGLVFGILGVVGLVPLLWAVVRCQLPQHKLKKLDSILEEATALLHSAVQEGFVPSVAFVVEADCVLRNLRGHTENLRADVLSADGIRRQCLAAIKGLSTRVDVICQRVKDLRERIARVSEEERRKAADQERYRPAITSLPVYIQNTLDQRANDTEVGGFDVQARSYHGRKPFALSERLVPWLPMPAPTYTSVTPTFEYEPVRRSSYPDTASLQFSLNVSELGLAYVQKSTIVSSPRATITSAQIRRTKGHRARAMRDDGLSGCAPYHRSVADAGANRRTQGADLARSTGYHWFIRLLAKCSGTDPTESSAGTIS
ncbi:hypothetical protein EUX98_g9168 [Antrodiella citrinella]|uniref:Uncharacterized protein n=1 Tax=Antrodiella citrinella TaxID=2447956 RepID=A0A4S4M353_9APHY|nr:hypothetical protein EUX98_g9168 [Antrodiella citrinella]